MRKVFYSMLQLAVIFSCSYLFAETFGKFFSLFFSDTIGGEIIGTKNSQFFIGLPLSYIFFLMLLLVGFGNNRKYWLVGVLLLPALWFELKFDLRHIYFPISIGVGAWILALGIRLLLKRYAPKLIRE